MSTQESRSIKPIPRLHAVTLASYKFRTLRKRRPKIRTLKIPDIEVFYISTGLYGVHKIFMRPGRSYFKSLKTLTGLEIRKLWMAALWTFSALQNQLCNLRRFIIGVNPDHSRLSKFSKFTNKMKRLCYFNDSFRAIPNRTHRALRLWPCRYTKEINFSPNVDIRGFPKLKALEIMIPPLSLTDLHLPNTLEEVTLIDSGPLSQTDYGHKFSLLLKELNTLPNLKNVDLFIPFKSYYQRAFKDLKVNNLTVRLSTEVGSFMEKNVVESVKEFINRTNSKVAFIPRNYTNQQYVDLLYFFEMHYEEYKKSFYLERLSFNFHSLYGVQNRVINYYTKMSESVQQINFALDINSLDWFHAWRMESWKKMSELLAGNTGHIKIIYNIKFNNEINKKTLSEMIEVAASLLQLMFINKGEQSNSVVEVNIVVDCPKDIEGLTLHLEKSFFGMRNIDLVACKLDAKMKGQYGEVARVLRRLKEDKSISKFVVDFEN